MLHMFFSILKYFRSQYHIYVLALETWARKEYPRYRLDINIADWLIIH